MRGGLDQGRQEGASGGQVVVGSRWWWEASGAGVEMTPSLRYISFKARARAILNCLVDCEDR